MKELIKQYRRHIIALCAVMAVLTIVFFAQNPKETFNTESSVASSSAAFTTLEPSNTQTESLQAINQPSQSTQMQSTQSQSTQAQSTQSQGTQQNSSQPANTHTDIIQNDTQQNNTCIISIDCLTILSNMDKVSSGIKEIIPPDGYILHETGIQCVDGDTAFSILQKACKINNIRMEASYTPIYDSSYIEGIGNIYEFDCGSTSGWMVSINGTYYNYSASKIEVHPGDKILWRYTCKTGADL